MRTMAGMVWYSDYEVYAAGYRAPRQVVATQERCAGDYGEARSHPCGWGTPPPPLRFLAGSNFFSSPGKAPPGAAPPLPLPPPLPPAPLAPSPKGLAASRDIYMRS